MTIYFLQIIVICLYFDVLCAQRICSADEYYKDGRKSLTSHEAAALLRPAAEDKYLPRKMLGTIIECT